jgi:hypothetical protein
VKPYVPKFRPEIVTVAPPVSPEFNERVKLTAGESKVKLRPLVPTTALTVTLDLGAVATVAAGVWHCTAVADVHDEVLHSAVPTNVVVSVRLYAPKLRPAIVTVPPPEIATLGGAGPDSTGASNVKALTARVPTTAPTVTLAYPLCTLATGIAHWTVVADDHAAVAHV